MKQYTFKLVLFLILSSFCDGFKNTFKKLLNKKLLSKQEHYERVNLFHCFKYCVNKENCDMFSYNAEFQICQLSDSKLDKFFDDAVQSDGWDIYFPTTSAIDDESNLYEAIAFKNEVDTKSVEIDVNIDSIYLTMCFWFKIKEISKLNVIFTMKNHWSCAYLQVYIDTNKKIYLKTDINNASIKYNSGEKFYLRTNYHICIVYENGTATWYIDGERIRTNIINDIENNRIEISKLLIGKAIRGYEENCLDDEGMGLEKGFLFDFNIFSQKLDESEINLVRGGRSTISPTVSWNDIKNKFVNNPNAVLEMTTNSKYYDARNGINK